MLLPVLQSALWSPNFARRLCAGKLTDRRFAVGITTFMRKCQEWNKLTVLFPWLLDYAKMVYSRYSQDANGIVRGSRDIAGLKMSPLIP